MDNEGSSIIIPAEAHPRRIRVGAGGSLTIPRVRQAYETILSHLDVRAEAEGLGIEFAAASPSPRGWLPCRAVGRVDRNPSAAVNVGSDGRRGLSRDLGDLEGRATSFFDLAVTTGRFSDRERAVRPYAERTGVAIPPAGKGGPHVARSLEDRVDWIPARPSDPADLEAWCRRKSGILPAALRAFGARKSRWPRNPDTGSSCWCLVGRRDDSNAPVALRLSVVARNPSRKMRAVSSWRVRARCLEAARSCSERACKNRSGVVYSSVRVKM